MLIGLLEFCLDGGVIIKMLYYDMDWMLMETFMYLCWNCY